NDQIEVVGRRGPEMEAAHQRVNLLHARHFLRLPGRIDDADVTAGTDHDEATVFQIETGRVLVHVLVRNDLSQELRRLIVARVAAEPVLHGKLNLSVREYFFDAGALDLA